VVVIGEIITIGDELISGRVCDTNAFFLSARISSFGMKISAISSVGDNPEQIAEVLKRALGRSDFVIVSGGLGPTDDDITAAVAADFFNLPLEPDEDFLKAIRHSLESRGLAWVESYKKMALLPKGAMLLDPKEACGFYLYSGDKPVFFLPGVPREVQLLAESRVLPILLSRDKDQQAVRQRVFKLFGPQEAKIGEVLDGVTNGESDAVVGFYPNFPENHVTVTVRDVSAERAEERLSRIEHEVDRRLGEFMVAKDNATLEEAVGELLRARGWHLAVAESCTGGLISQRITSVSGSSDYFDRGMVVYSNQAKHDLLGVSWDTLNQHGAVSHETADAMAVGARENSQADISLATTGIAGPTGGTDEKPVGTVFVALSTKDGVRSKRFQFYGRRSEITALTAQVALSWLRRFMTDDTFLFRH
jgi:nicotinamide-nucleotide amidase